MDIHFCDLCNESVPAGHLLDGRAFRRKGRVVCAACDAAMGGSEKATAVAEGAPVGHATPVVPMAPIAAPSHTSHTSHGGHAQHPPRRRGRGPTGSGMLAFAALCLTLLVGAGAAFAIVRLMQESNLQRENLRDGHAGLERKLQHIDTRVDGVVGSVASQMSEARSELGDRFDLVTLELSQQIKKLSEGLAARDEQIRELGATLRGMDGDLMKTDEEIQTRLDSLMVAAVGERQELSMIADRLASLEDLVHSGAMVAPADDSELDAGPAWQVALDDLANADSAVRWNAVQALAESGDPAVVPHLVPLLNDADIWVRMAAAGALGDLGAIEGVGPLIETLEDPETAVRERAMLSLREITGRSFQFDPSGAEGERAKVVKKWRDWWQKSQPSPAE